jgi:hypothetical protein
VTRTKQINATISAIRLWIALALHFLYLAAPSPAQSRLVGWWKFDEGSGATAYDDSRLGHHGALHGGCSFTKDGLRGGAIDFACLDGYISVSHSSNLEPATGTIQVWVKPALLQNADILFKTSNVLQQTGAMGTYGGVYGLQIKADGGAVAYVLNDDPATPGAPWRFAYAPAGSIQAAKWHHLAMRWDGTRLSIFVDGLLKGQAPYKAIPGIGLSYGGASEFVIGQGTYSSDQAAHEFLGKLDELRFYNYARTNEQISSDWHQRATNMP